MKIVYGKVLIFWRTMYARLNGQELMDIVKYNFEKGKEMDKRSEEIIKNYKKMRIGVDEPFRFHCTQCGDCCRNRDDIMLTARDMYNMSKALGFTPEETARRYCEAYVGHDSRVPVIRLKPERDGGHCPLLKDNKCAVHRAKPAVCAMFPIGRGLSFGMENQEARKDRPPETEYIFVNPGCGDGAGTQTVREWLGTFNIPLDDPFFRQWNQLIIHMSGIIREIEKDLHEILVRTMWDVAVQFMYLQYDTQKDFMPQFERNAAAIRNTLADFMNKTNQGRPETGGGQE